MKVLHKTTIAVTRLWDSVSEFRLGNIRADKVQYFLALALAMIFYNLRDTYFYTDVRLFGVNMYTLTYCSYAVSTVAVTLLWSEKFQSLIRISAALTLAGFLPWLFLPDSELKLVFAMVCWLGLGGCAAGARFGYAFAANNSERMLGLVVVLVCFGLSYLLTSFKLSGLVLTHILPALLIIGMIVLLLRFREQDLKAHRDTEPPGVRSVYFALAYMIAFYVIDAFLATGIEQSNENGILLFGGFCIGAALLSIVINVIFKRSIWHVWNLFFLFALLSSIFALFPATHSVTGLSYVFNGLRMIGYIAAIYMLGGVQKRFASLRLYKKCAIIIALFVPIAIILANAIYSAVPSITPWVNLAITAAIFAASLLLSPLSYKYLFSADWMDDFNKPDMTGPQEGPTLTELFKDLSLTPREQELTTLVLAGQSQKDIASKMGISYSTVRFHTNNLYRKLDIQSRSELLSMFALYLQDGTPLGGRQEQETD